VERSLYDILTKSLLEAWDKGLQMHVLGHGVLALYPCICFFCGDDPCQHRVSGLQESNTRYGCVYCMFPTQEGVRYNPVDHKPRNVVEIQELCDAAERISQELSNGKKTISKEEKKVLGILKKQNVHPHMNLFQATTST